MITEDYVSFETAKLLKEKGFDEITFTWYTGKGKLCFGRNTYDDYHMNHFSNMATAKDKNKCSAPTLQMAMKWLREEKNTFIDMSSRFSKNADKDVCFSYSCKKLIDKYRSSYEIGDGEWLNYEQACEAAIKYCLENLI